MSQLVSFYQAESPTDSVELFIPDEVIESPEGYVISIYRPQEYHFQEWLRDVDETIMDMTGYSVHNFAVVPTFGGPAEGSLTGYPLTVEEDQLLITIS
jgi:hypothetical protein